MRKIYDNDMFGNYVLGSEEGNQYTEYLIFIHIISQLEDSSAESSG